VYPPCLLFCIHFLDEVHEKWRQSGAKAETCFHFVSARKFSKNSFEVLRLGLQSKSENFHHYPFGYPDQFRNRALLFEYRAALSCNSNDSRVPIHSCPRGGDCAVLVGSELADAGVMKDEFDASTRHLDREERTART
jgi:hypothetical protein